MEVSTSLSIALAAMGIVLLAYFIYSRYIDKIQRYILGATGYLVILPSFRGLITCHGLRIAKLHTVATTQKRTYEQLVPILEYLYDALSSSDRHLSHLSPSARDDIANVYGWVLFLDYASLHISFKRTYSLAQSSSRWFKKLSLGTSAVTQSLYWVPRVSIVTSNLYFIVIKSPPCITSGKSKPKEPLNVKYEAVNGHNRWTRWCSTPLGASTSLLTGFKAWIAPKIYNFLLNTLEVTISTSKNNLFVLGCGDFADDSQAYYPHFDIFNRNLTFNVLKHRISVDTEKPSSFYEVQWKIGSIAATYSTCDIYSKQRSHCVTTLSSLLDLTIVFRQAKDPANQTVWLPIFFSGSLAPCHFSIPASLFPLLRLVERTSIDRSPSNNVKSMDGVLGRVETFLISNFGNIKKIWLCGNFELGALKIKQFVDNYSYFSFDFSPIKLQDKPSAIGSFRLLIPAIILQLSSSQFPSMSSCQLRQYSADLSFQVDKGVISLFSTISIHQLYMSCSIQAVEFFRTYFSSVDNSSAEKVTPHSHLRSLLTINWFALFLSIEIKTSVFQLVSAPCKDFDQYGQKKSFCALLKLYSKKPAVLICGFNSGTLSLNFSLPLLKIASKMLESDHKKEYSSLIGVSEASVKFEVSIPNEAYLLSGPGIFVSDISFFPLDVPFLVMLKQLHNVFRIGKSIAPSVHSSTVGDCSFEIADTFRISIENIHMALSVDSVASSYVATISDLDLNLFDHCLFLKSLNFTSLVGDNAKDILFLPECRATYTVESQVRVLDISFLNNIEFNIDLVLILLLLETIRESAKLILNKGFNDVFSEPIDLDQLHYPHFAKGMHALLSTNSCLIPRLLENMDVAIVLRTSNYVNFKISNYDLSGVLDKYGFIIPELRKACVDEISNLSWVEIVLRRPITRIFLPSLVFSVSIQLIKLNAYSSKFKKSDLLDLNCGQPFSWEIIDRELKKLSFFERIRARSRIEIALEGDDTQDYIFSNIITVKSLVISNSLHCESKVPLISSEALTAWDIDIKGILNGSNIPWDTTNAPSSSFYHVFPSFYFDFRAGIPSFTSSEKSSYDYHLPEIWLFKLFCSDCSVKIPFNFPVFLLLDQISFYYRTLKSAFLSVLYAPSIPLIHYFDFSSPEGSPHFELFYGLSKLDDLFLPPVLCQVEKLNIVWEDDFSFEAKLDKIFAFQLAEACSKNHREDLFWKSMEPATLTSSLFSGIVCSPLIASSRHPDRLQSSEEFTSCYKALLLYECRRYISSIKKILNHQSFRLLEVSLFHTNFSLLAPPSLVERTENFNWLPASVLSSYLSTALFCNEISFKELLGKNLLKSFELLRCSWITFSSQKVIAFIRQEALPFFVCNKLDFEGFLAIAERIRTPLTTSESNIALNNHIYVASESSTNRHHFIHSLNISFDSFYAYIFPLKTLPSLLYWSDVGIDLLSKSDFPTFVNPPYSLSRYFPGLPFWDKIRMTSRPYKGIIRSRVESWIAVVFESSNACKHSSPYDIDNSLWFGSCRPFILRYLPSGVSQDSFSFSGALTVLLQTSQFPLLNQEMQFGMASSISLYDKNHIRATSKGSDDSFWNHKICLFYWPTFSATIVAAYESCDPCLSSTVYNLKILESLGHYHFQFKGIASIAVVSPQVAAELGFYRYDPFEHFRTGRIHLDVVYDSPYAESKTNLFDAEFLIVNYLQEYYSFARRFFPPKCLLLSLRPRQGALFARGVSSLVFGDLQPTDLPQPPVTLSSAFSSVKCEYPLEPVLVRYLYFLEPSHVLKEPSEFNFTPNYYVALQGLFEKSSLNFLLLQSQEEKEIEREWYVQYWELDIQNAHLAVILPPNCADTDFFVQLSKTYLKNSAKMKQAVPLFSSHDPFIIPNTEQYGICFVEKLTMLDVNELSIIPHLTTGYMQHLLTKMGDLVSGFDQELNQLIKSKDFQRVAAVKDKILYLEEKRQFLNKIFAGSAVSKSCVSLASSTQGEKDIPLNRQYWIVDKFCGKWNIFVRNNILRFWFAFSMYSASSHAFDYSTIQRLVHNQIIKHCKSLLEGSSALASDAAKATRETVASDIIRHLTMTDTDYLSAEDSETLSSDLQPVSRLELKFLKPQISFEANDDIVLYQDKMADGAIILAAAGANLAINTWVSRGDAVQSSMLRNAMKFGPFSHRSSFVFEEPEFYVVYDEPWSSVYLEKKILDIESKVISQESLDYSLLFFSSWPPFLNLLEVPNPDSCAFSMNEGDLFVKIMESGKLEVSYKYQDIDFLSSHRAVSGVSSMSQKQSSPPDLIEVNFPVSFDMFTDTSAYCVFYDIVVNVLPFGDQCRRKRQDMLDGLLLAWQSGDIGEHVEMLNVQYGELSRHLETYMELFWLDKYRYAQAKDTSHVLTPRTQYSDLRETNAGLASPRKSIFFKGESIIESKKELETDERHKLGSHILSIFHLRDLFEFYRQILQNIPQILTNDKSLNAERERSLLKSIWERYFAIKADYLLLYESFLISITKHNILRPFYPSSAQIDGEHNEMLSIQGKVRESMKILVNIPKLTWNFLQDSGESFLEAIFMKTFFLYSWFDDGSIEALMVNCFLGATNKLPGAYYKEAMKPLNQIAATPTGESPHIRIFWKERAPIGGIPLIERVEINILPTEFQLTTEIGSSLINFLYPYRKEAVMSATTSQDPRSGTFSHLPKVSTQHIEEMKNRSQKNKSFVTIFIPASTHRISFKGRGEARRFQDIEKIPLELSNINYNNKTWSWYELMLAIRRDAIRILFYNTGTLVREKLGMRRSEM